MKTELELKARLNWLEEELKKATKSDSKRILAVRIEEVRWSLGMMPGYY